VKLLDRVTASFENHIKGDESLERRGLAKATVQQEGTFLINRRLNVEKAEPNQGT
jgi:hypothetical protein